MKWTKFRGLDTTIFGNFGDHENPEAQEARDRFVSDLRGLVDKHRPHLQSAVYNGTQLGTVDLLEPTT